MTSGQTCFTPCIFDKNGVSYSQSASSAHFQVTFPLIKAQKNKKCCYHKFTYPIMLQLTSPAAIFKSVLAEKLQTHKNVCTKTNAEIHWNSKTKIDKDTHQDINTAKLRVVLDRGGRERGCKYTAGCFRPRTHSRGKYFNPINLSSIHLLICTG